jgi:hypothetical protein
MTTIIINERTRKGKIILELIREMGVGKVIDENSDKVPNQPTLKAMHDAETGNTVKCTSFSDYLEKVR